MSTLEKIKAEIMQEYHDNADDMNWSYRAGLAKALDIIDRYADQEPCEDTIAYNDDFATALVKISKYEDKMASEDAVSRQAVIDNIKNGFHWETVNGITAETALKQVIHDVEIMPSVQPTKFSTRCPECGAWFGYNMRAAQNEPF